MGKDQIQSTPLSPPQLSSVCTRKLIFVTGKGGVGKTTVSQALAIALSQKGARTLWVCFEDPLQPPGILQQINTNLFHLNCEPHTSFEEYIGLKIKMPSLTRIFLNNKLVQYLSKAAPGIHELVMMGKIWFECNHYDHLVIDMPSTGYTLAMFQSVENFARLFHGGPVHHDAVQMLETFQDPVQSGLLILALPEEMSLRESLELDLFLQKQLPSNRAAFLVNRLFPTHSPTIGRNAATPATTAAPDSVAHSPESWKTPFPSSAFDFIQKRGILESYNLRLWRDANIPFSILEYCRAASYEELVVNLACTLRERAHQ